MAAGRGSLGRAIRLQLHGISGGAALHHADTPWPRARPARRGIDRGPPPRRDLAGAFVLSRARPVQPPPRQGCIQKRSRRFVEMQLTFSYRKYSAAARANQALIYIILAGRTNVLYTCRQDAQRKAPQRWCATGLSRNRTVCAAGQQKRNDYSRHLYIPPLPSDSKHRP